MQNDIPEYGTPECIKRSGSRRLFLPVDDWEGEPTDKWYPGLEEVPELGIIAYIQGSGI